jgi:hypothetical protein
MDFKLISKNNVGSVVLLLLVIALSQARVFNFLIDTALGRFFLIIFVLCLSHCHKILGVVGVLFVIIMFNSNMYEGFGNNSNSDSSSSSNSKPNFNSNSNNSSSNNDSSNSTTQPNTDQIKQVITQKIKDASQNNTTDSSDSSDSSKKNRNSKAAEGFDILGIENNIKRGKQSNSIPVNSFMRDADSVAPYEGTSFLGSFSPF